MPFLVVSGIADAFEDPGEQLLTLAPTLALELPSPLQVANLRDHGVACWPEPAIDRLLRAARTASPGLGTDCDPCSESRASGLADSDAVEQPISYR